MAPKFHIITDDGFVRNKASYVAGQCGICKDNHPDNDWCTLPVDHPGDSHTAMGIISYSTPKPLPKFKSPFALEEQCGILKDPKDPLSYFCEMDPFHEGVHEVPNEDVSWEWYHDPHAVDPTTFEQDLLKALGL